MAADPASQHDRDLETYIRRQKTLRQLMIHRAQAEPDEKPTLDRQITDLRTELDDRHRALNNAAVESATGSDAP